MLRVGEQLEADAWVERLTRRLHAMTSCDVDLAVYPKTIGAFEVVNHDGPVYFAVRESCNRLERDDAVPARII